MLSNIITKTGKNNAIQLQPSIFLNSCVSNVQRSIIRVFTEVKNIFTHHQIIDATAARHLYLFNFFIQWSVPTRAAIHFLRLPLASHFFLPNYFLQLILACQPPRAVHGRFFVSANTTFLFVTNSNNTWVTRFIPITTKGMCGHTWIQGLPIHTLPGY